MILLSYDPDPRDASKISYSTQVNGIVFIAVALAKLQIRLLFSKQFSMKISHLNLIVNFQLGLPLPLATLGFWVSSQDFQRVSILLSFSLVQPADLFTMLLNVRRSHISI